MALMGCGSGTSPNQRGNGNPPPPIPGGRYWTVLVYMDADNDLEQFSILNMNQMEKLGTNDNIALVVQWDRRSGFDISNGDWTGTRRYLVTHDSIDDNSIRSIMLQDMGEVDMANPQNLKSFIQWGAQQYPAQHYLVVIWNHGAGWRKQTQEPGRGVLYDDTNGTFMTMNQLALGLNAGIPLDLVAFDASLMGMVEVAYEIKDRASYVAFSEESPPGPGYPYDKILAHLFANPKMSPAELGSYFVQEHIAAYPNSNVTQSTIDLKQMNALAQSIDSFASALRNRLSDSNFKGQIRNLRQQTQSYGYEYYRDLYHFADLVDSNVSDGTVRAAARQVKTSLLTAILSEAHTGPDVTNSHGLSIYLPVSGDYISTYTNLRFTIEHPAWKEFLLNY